MKRPSRKANIGTESIHAGENRAFCSVTTPIVQASTFYFHDTKEIFDYTAGRIEHSEYGRYGNPTRLAAEKKLAALEGAEKCVLFDCGMSAVTAAILPFVSQGDHIVLTDDMYRRTGELARDFLPRFGIQSDIVPVCDYEAMDKAVRPTTRLIVTESPTNPYLNVLDFARIAEIGEKHNVLTVVDSTFGTPYNQKPLEYGIDVVVHSTTKYLAGHNDVLGGAVLGSKVLLQPVIDFQKMTGGIPDPSACYLLLRGLKTFAVRMKQLNETGMRVAQFLEEHPKVRRVYYPGLPSHQHHDVAARQMSGFGAVVTFEIDGTLEDVVRFLDALELCLIAPSFGGAETLITHPAIVSYYNVPREERIALGIIDQLFRLAVGLEDVGDIIADLERGLKEVTSKG